MEEIYKGFCILSSGYKVGTENSSKWKVRFQIIVNTQPEAKGKVFEPLDLYPSETAAEMVGVSSARAIIDKG